MTQKDIAEFYGCSQGEVSLAVRMAGIRWEESKEDLVNIGEALAEYYNRRSAKYQGKADLYAEARDRIQEKLATAGGSGC